MPKEWKGYIYALKSTETDKIYIGSTLIDLRTRFSNHKSRYMKLRGGERKGCRSYIIFDYGIDKVFIEKLEEYDNIDEYSLRKKEGEFIKDNKRCVNLVIPNKNQIIV